MDVPVFSQQAYHVQTIPFTIAKKTPVLDPFLCKIHTGPAHFTIQISSERTVSVHFTEICIVDTLNQRVLHRFVGHNDEITSLLIMPRSHDIITGSRDTAVKVWNSQTGELLYTLRKHDYEVTALVRLPDDTIMSGDAQGFLYCWDVHRGYCISGYQVPEPITRFCYHPTDRLLYVCQLKTAIVLRAGQHLDRHVYDQLIREEGIDLAILDIVRECGRRIREKGIRMIGRTNINNIDYISIVKEPGAELDILLGPILQKNELTLADVYFE